MKLLLPLIFLTLQVHASTLSTWFKIDDLQNSSTSDAVTQALAQVSGNPTLTTGKVNSAINFDGLDDQIQFNSSSSLDFLNSQSFTISAWVKDDRPNGINSWATVVSKGNTRAGYCSGSTSGIVLGRFSNVQNRFIFALKNDTTSCMVIDSGPISFDNSSFPGFHLLTMVVNRELNILSAYVNLLKVGEVNLAGLGNLNLSSFPILIGAGNQKWQGLIDEVKIFQGAQPIDEIRNGFFLGNSISDNDDPTVSWLTPNVENYSLSILKDQQIPLSVTASDNNGISLVQYVANNSVIGESLSPPYLFTWERMNPGVYSLKAKVYDIAGKFSESNPITVTVTDLNFSNTINPTLNPIGGGKGYTDILSESTSDYVVTDAASFIAALGVATAGKVIYVKDTASINLSGRSNISIPAGVTIASGRGRGSLKGGLIYSNDKFPEQSYISLLVTGGSGIRLTGLRLKGPNPEVLDQTFDGTGGVGNLIQTFHEGLTVDNCEIYAWDKWALWLRSGGNHVIKHNFFHDTLRSGYGYPIWVGGSSPPVGTLWNILIEANLFQRCRHCIASSGHLNSWEARFNIFLDQQLFTNVDRHDQVSNGIGGDNTSLHHNLFFDKINNTWGMAAPATANGRLLVFNNWLSTEAFLSETLPPEPYIGGNPKVSTFANRLNFNRALLPQIKVNASVNEGVAPLTVKFTTTGSTDPNGLSINQFRWTFGDGDTYGKYSELASPSYTFTNPGRYLVRLMARNTKGVANFVDTPILVKPNVPGKWLTLWLLDSYIGTLKNFYKKEVLVNGTVVWSDDAQGNEGWQYIKVDVTQLLSTKTTADVRVRLRSINAMNIPSDPINGISEIRLWVDDVYLFGGNIQNGDFEAGDKNWTGLYNGSWGYMVRGESVRSGSQSIVLRRGLYTSSPANQSVEVQQIIPLL